MNGRVKVYFNLRGELSIIGPDWYIPSGGTSVQVHVYFPGSVSKALRAKVSGKNSQRTEREACIVFRRASPHVQSCYRLYNAETFMVVLRMSQIWEFSLCHSSTYLWNSGARQSQLYWIAFAGQSAVWRSTVLHIHVCSDNSNFTSELKWRTARLTIVAGGFHHVSRLRSEIPDSERSLSK